MHYLNTALLAVIALLLGYHVYEVHPQPRGLNDWEAAHLLPDATCRSMHLAVPCFDTTP
jgi:hypothetical protein